MCPIVDGMAVNATNENAQKLDKVSDDTTVGQVTLANAIAASGPTVTNVQREINSLDSFTGRSAGSAYNATPSWTNNDVGSSSDPVKTRADALTQKFNSTAGHAHDGTTGNGGPISGSSLVNVPLHGFIIQGTDLTGITGTSTDVSSVLVGQAASTGSTVEGIVVTAPYNKVLLRHATGASTDDPFVDGSGNVVYGRITKSGSVWTLSFYVDISGTETAYNFGSSSNIRWYYQKLFNPVSDAPVYSEFALIPSDNATAEVITATTALQGKVQLSSSTPPSVAASGSAGTANASVANADHTHTIGAGVVTNTMQANMAANSAKANLTGSPAAPSDVSAVSAATASTLMTRDSNANTQANSVDMNISSTATAATITTVTVASSPWQRFTGATTQTLKLPDATTLNTGRFFWVLNESAGAITVKDNGSNTLATVAASGDQMFILASNGSTNGTWHLGSTSGSAITSLTGDVVATGPGAAAATIQANVVSNSKLATMATQQFKGRTTAGTGNVEDLTATQATAILNAMVGDSGSGGTKGLVPAPASGDAAASKFLKADGTWSTAGSGTGTGAINYIANPNAEVDTSGWATYSDAAQNIPVDATGGTATGLTFSRSTSSPLIGTASFLMVQTNSTSIQGKGVSYDFTIDSAFKAQMFSIVCNYNASSTFVASNGTTAPLNDGTSSTNAGNSDLEFFIYDVTNGVLIPVSPQVITSNGSNNFIFKGEFQAPSNSVSLRLAIHVATANANATGWTFKFDNVLVGPQSTLLGPPITDLTTALTVTLSGVGTATSTSFESRRVGQFLEGMGHFTTGTVAGTTFSISLPSGLAIDSTAIAAVSTKVGNIFQLTSASNNIYSGNEAYVLFYDGSDTSKIYGAVAVASSAYTKANGTGLFANTTACDYSFRVPIAGWSSTTVMSNDSDTRIVSASIALAVDYAVSANAVIKFDTVLFDSHSCYSTSTGLYTVPVSGRYRVSATISTTSTAAGIYVAVNGTGKVYLVTPANSPEGGSQTVTCVAGDTIGVFSDSTKTIDGTSTPYFSAISIERLTGPTTVAAADSVTARYYGSSTTISGSLATIVWTTKDWDSHGAMSSGVYTIPISGKYQVNTLVSISVGGAASAYNWDYQLQKNGTVVSELNEAQAASTTNGVAKLVSDILNCVAGDTVRLQLSTSANSPSIAAGNGKSYFSIARVGN